MSTEKKSILFLCTGNSCRSQMAEGWSRVLGGEKWLVRSAGIETHGLNPLAVRAMADVGIDISGQFSKLVSDLDRQDFDYVITVCDYAAEQCPVFPGPAQRIHKSFADPPILASSAVSEDEPLVFYRQVRDEIGSFVKEFLQQKG